MPNKKAHKNKRQATLSSEALLAEPAQPEDWTRLPLIKVVGVSASGKSTLVAGLRQAGYHARPVSQEHSHLADLWQQFETPRVLIYLDNDLENQQRRRPDVTWDQQNLQVEQERLAHARQHADLHINTTNLGSEAVLQIALAFLQHKKIRRAPDPLPAVAATGSAQGK